MKPKEKTRGLSKSFIIYKLKKKSTLNIKKNHWTVEIKRKYSNQNILYIYFNWRTSPTLTNPTWPWLGHVTQLYCRVGTPDQEWSSDSISCVIASLGNVQYCQKYVPKLYVGVYICVISQDLMKYYNTTGTFYLFAVFSSNFLIQLAIMIEYPILSVRHPSH